MNDTNYISGIIKILESPKQKILNNNTIVTQFRAQIPQFRNKGMVTVTCWGNLARDIVTSYKKNDYVLIEGYLSLRNKKQSTSLISKSKKVEITVLKLYPFIKNYKHSNNKI